MSATEQSPDQTTDASGRRYDVRGAFRYRTSKTRRGSSSLGPCEVCGKNADEVYIQTQQRYVVVGLSPDMADVVDEDGGVWTEHRCKTWFGHEACLVSVR